MSRPYTKPEHYGFSDGRPIRVRGENHPDSEGRWPVEPIGFHIFAWLPKRCRNGKVRWLRWVERHGPGDYTLSDRCG